MKLVPALCSLALSAVALTAAAHAQNLRGVTANGDVYAVDSATGSGTLLGPSGFTGLESLATTGCVTYSVSGNTLISIDRATGVGTALGSIPLVAVRAMSLNIADGLLYAVEDGGDPLSRDVLYTIDTTTRSTQRIGSLGYNGIVGLAFRFGTELYAWDTGTGTGAGLLRVDPTTGASVDVNPAAGGSAATEQFLAFDQLLHTLLTGRDELYSIATNGVKTLIGSGGYSDLRGLEYNSVPHVYGYCFQAKANTCGMTPGILFQLGPSGLSGFGGTEAYFGSFGVLLYSPNGPASLPFEGGELCINPLGRRASHAIAATGGSPGACGAQFFIDLEAYASGALGGNPAPFLKTPGQRVHMQFWSHDVQPAKSYLSPAVGYNVCN